MKLKHFIRNFIYHFKEQLKRFQIIYNIILYHLHIFNFHTFKNDYRQNAYPTLHVRRVSLEKKCSAIDSIDLQSLLGLCSLCPNLWKLVCLIQETLTSTIKTAPGGLLRLILEEDPWNRQQSLQYNSSYRLGPFKSFGKNSEGRKMGSSKIVRNQYGQSPENARPHFAETTH